MDKTETLIGKYVPDFELPGVDGSVHHLARYLADFRAVGVIFICNHCPYVQLYLDRLKQIQADFQPQGLTLIGINANDATQYPEDGFEPMKAFAIAHQLNFPYLRDVTQEVAQGFGAQKTPEAFLLDQAGILRYSGGIDDHPQDATAVQTSYFRDAIVQVLQGETVTLASTEAVGCSLKWQA
ncbi:MAG: thioredoxin family protein [Leptolyngbyaceae bacterium]|nr:thioredoxin family protein [Leptolyngbyaceae bacterium]